MGKIVIGFIALLAILNKRSRFCMLLFNSELIEGLYSLFILIVLVGMDSFAAQIPNIFREGFGRLVYIT